MLTRDDLFEVLLDNLVTFCKMPEKALRMMADSRAEIKEQAVAEGLKPYVKLLNDVREGHHRKVPYLIHLKLLDEGVTWNGRSYDFGTGLALGDHGLAKVCNEELSALWTYSSGKWDPAKAMTNLLRLMRALKKFNRY